MCHKVLVYRYLTPLTPPGYVVRARICRSFKGTRYWFSAWRAGTKPYLSYWPARLHRLAKSIPRNRCLGSINVYKYGFWRQIGLLYPPGWDRFLGAMKDLQIPSQSFRVKFSNVRTAIERSLWAMCELFFWQFAHRSTLIFFHSKNQRSLIAFERSLNL